ncbi:MAG TPA: polysaccharide deacetylase family protein [Candidatus Methylacidiphilales bacterium]|nr:polysaccharide deacetylase family protein [Candidatus Methylacidiphilales bacterium]
MFLLRFLFTSYPALKLGLFFYLLGLAGLYGYMIVDAKWRQDQRVTGYLDSAQDYFTKNPGATALPRPDGADAAGGDVQAAGSTEALPTQNDEAHPEGKPANPGSAIVYDDKAFNGNPREVSPTTPPANTEAAGMQNTSGGTVPAGGQDLSGLLPGAPNPSGVGTASSGDHLPTNNGAPAEGAAPAPAGEGTAPMPPDNGTAATLPPNGAEATAPAPAPGAATAPVMSLQQGDPNAPVVAENPIYVLCYYQILSTPNPNNMYAISAKTFESQLAFLKKNGYTALSFADFQKYLQKGLTPPAKSVVITLDGGFKNAVTVAKPILAKYGYPWTFFVYTDFVGSGEDKVSWQDLADLEAAGVDVQSHSRSPANLTMREKKSPEEYESWVLSEMVESKKVLEQKLNKTITALAYPYGDYNHAIQQKAQEAGYQYLLCASDTPVDSRTVAVDIPRIPIYKPTEKQFESLVKQGALPLGEITPGPGQILTERRPSVSATFPVPFNNPKSIKATIEGEEVKTTYEPETRKLTLAVEKDLDFGTIKVGVTGRDGQTKQALVYNWQFTVQKPAATPAPVIEKTSAKPSKPGAAKDKDKDKAKKPAKPKP